MYKFQIVTKSGWLSIVAAGLLSFIGMSLARAATYTYNLTDVDGYITTTCDNCILNSSNIVAWSMSVPGFSIASTDPGANLSVPAGDTDMVATPEGINFNFTGTYYGISFVTPSGHVDYDDAGPNGNIGFGPAEGVIAECDNTGYCNFTGGTEGTRAIALPVVPFAGAVTYVFTGTVTSGSDEYASCVGTTVAGTLTIDFGAGNGSLPVSFTTPWNSGSTSSTPRVVTSTLQGVCVSFGYGSDDNDTAVTSAEPEGSSVPNEYDAYENDWLTPSRNAEAGQRLQFFGGTGPNAPFDANGLPVFANATGGAIGHVYYYSTGATGDATYTITSFTRAVPTVSLAPQSLSFPNTVVGSTSAPSTVTLKNTGTGDLSITGITLTGGQTDDFALSNTCGASLAANATCTISATFNPVAAGAKQATFTVADNAHASQRSVALTGTATAVPAPAVTLSASSLSFASQGVGMASAAQTVILTNTGTATLSISSIHISGWQADDFTLAKTCGSSLAAGKSCELSVTFKPVAAGAKSATVIVADNAHGSQRTVALAGTGR
jgi:Abnormal spindle-like microcephaly-assoc'd, ASPM-SPD-2-Hydin